MYKVKMLCFEPEIRKEPYEDEPCINNPFNTYDEAYEYAAECAENECEDWNMDCDDNVSFGVVYNKNSIHINYYYLNGENDTTGNTETTTIYYVKEI